VIDPFTALLAASTVAIVLAALVAAIGREFRKEEEHRMYFKPPSASTIQGRTAIEVWDAERHVATIYGQRGGLHLVCEPGFEPVDLAIEPQQPYGVQIGLHRQ
jgi:hypothetical protein